MQTSSLELSEPLISSVAETAISTNHPAWAFLVAENPNWQWRDERFVSNMAMKEPVHAPPTNWLKRWMVKHAYATHNNAPAVQKTLNLLLSQLPAEGWGLNFGAGTTRLHPRLLTLDVIDRPNIDLVSDGKIIPLKDKSLDLVVSQEVIEHIGNPVEAISEVHRVLKPGGAFYCQAPFTIGYHPGPTDFWRFTRQAWPMLFPQDQWDLELLEVAVGHGTGFYRIAVEFCAVTASSLHGKLYEPVKGLAAIGLMPFKLFDRLSPQGQAKDRIPGGYFCVARKRK